MWYGEDDRCRCILSMMWVCKIAYDDNGLGFIPSRCYRHPVLVDDRHAVVLTDNKEVG